MAKIPDYTGPIADDEILLSIPMFDEETGEMYNAMMLQKKPEAPDLYVEIKIPLQIIPMVQEKLSQLILMFSDLKRIPKDGYLELSGINIKYVPAFLTELEFNQLSGAGVIFDDNIVALFS